MYKLRVGETVKKKRLEFPIAWKFLDNQGMWLGNYVVSHVLESLHFRL